MFTDADNQTHTQATQSSSTAISSHARNVDLAIRNAEAAVLKLQHADGYWVFELEADCTIPSEYIMMMHYLGEIDTDLQAKIAHYLRARQSTDGSYPLFTGGHGDI
ncbi:MAG: squalene--hopene cyclase, partial [Methylococcales bacterium]|nr:squalene--hopene cyclase [Methylococcales bacterium]